MTVFFSERIFLLFLLKGEQRGRSFWLFYCHRWIKSLSQGVGHSKLAILKATDSIISGAAGFFVALIAIYKEKSPIIVMLLACAAVFIVERIWVFI